MQVIKKYFLPRLTTTLYLIILLPLVLALIGILFLDQYKKTLISHELSGLRRQADTLAIMIGKLEGDEASVIRRNLSLESSKLLLPLAGRDNEVRVRLFQPDGTLLADTRSLSQFIPRVEVYRLPKLEEKSQFKELLKAIKSYFYKFISSSNNYPIYIEAVTVSALQFDEVLSALGGTNAAKVRKSRNGKLILSVAVPIGDIRRVRGALMLSVNGNLIDEDVNQLQYSFLKIFIIVFGLTFVLGLIFSRRITIPISRLAKAADKISSSRNKIEFGVSSFLRRNDEIGELAHSLDEMTKNLWRRMDEIALFAADVSHELKNPLTSLKSAVETLPKIKEKKQKEKLLGVIINDVERLDRLISDISAASRLDSDLSRDEMKRINISNLVCGFIDIRATTLKDISFKLNIEENIFLLGNEGRLVQVLDNLIGNAVSFSPKKSNIIINLSTSNGKVFISVIDEGPGIPEGKTKNIFDRFYSQRPSKEDFGKHSGLGLSIANQIIKVHKGEIFVENLYNENKNILGAKFTIVVGELK